MTSIATAPVLPHVLRAALYVLQHGHHFSETAYHAGSAESGPSSSVVTGWRLGPHLRLAESTNGTLWLEGGHAWYAIPRTLYVSSSGGNAPEGIALKRLVLQVRNGWSPDGEMATHFAAWLGLIHLVAQREGISPERVNPYMLSSTERTADGDAAEVLDEMTFRRIHQPSLVRAADRLERFSWSTTIPSARRQLARAAADELVARRAGRR
jgi:hypothetical protein